MGWIVGFMSLSIVVAENIPYAKEAFSGLGSTTVLARDQITPQTIRDADVLIVRSTTKVTRSLLEGSKVKFVGTATIGIDHVDLDFLQERKITFASAPGSNANSVSEYITEVLLMLAREKGKPLSQSVLAIVGVGNVGSRVAKKAEALGMTVLRNDPPKARETNDPIYLAQEEALARADHVTFHVPLTRSGPDRTEGMINSRLLKLIRPGATLINTSRGPISVEKDMLNALSDKTLSHLVLDVWQGEPEVDPATLERVFLGSPHIAGHAFDAKVKGTRMMYEAVCKWAGHEPDFDFAPLLPAPEIPQLDLTYETEDDDEALLLSAIRRVYEARMDDTFLRNLVETGKDVGRTFQNYRKTYRQRREFYNTTVVLPASRARLADIMRSLRFQTITKGE